MASHGAESQYMVDERLLHQTRIHIRYSGAHHVLCTLTSRTLPWGLGGTVNCTVSRAPPGALMTIALIFLASVLVLLIVPRWVGARAAVVRVQRLDSDACTWAGPVRLLATAANYGGQSLLSMFVLLT